MINLINLPQLNSLDDKLDPPMGLMYIAAMLRSKGHQVKITDLSFIDRENWKEAVGYAEVYGMTVFSSSLHLAVEINKIAKENNPDCTVIVGGPHPTALPEETALLFDCVIKGEGEFVLEKQELEGLRGVVTANQIENLNSVLPPARDLVDLKAYHRKVLGQQATTMVTSRGCPYRCAFCYQEMFGHKVRTFSNKRVIQELISVIATYGIKAFIFYDDTFALNRSRFHSLCAELAKLNIIFRCNGDARHNTLEDFEILYRAGCREIEFGTESGSQKILDRIHKNVTVEQNKQAIKNAQRAGLLAKSFLMIGNPGETRETVEETKQFVIEADPDQFTLFTFIPLPGCAIWKDPEKYGIKITSKDFKNYFSIAGNYEGGAVVDTEELTGAEIKNLKEELLVFLRARGQRGELQDYYHATHV